MFDLLLSAFLGVLISKLVDNSSKMQGKQNVFYIVGCIGMMLLLWIYDLAGKLAEPPMGYVCIKSVIEDWDNDLTLKGIAFACILIGIAWLNVKEDGKLSFKQYSKKISNFTRRIHEDSIVTLIAGDMDFFGRIQVEQAETKGLMNENAEYKQLLDYRGKIELRILCSNKLSTERKNAILEDTISPEILYNKYRVSGDLNDSAFQQLLRIGKIQGDFKKVDIRFYNSDAEDKHLRARFVDNAGIVYRSEGKKSKRSYKDTFKELPKNLSELKEKLKGQHKVEELYSVNYLRSQEFVHYEELFNLKWNACEKEECQKITSFCESLYRYVTGDDKKNKIALVYVNSYEIARKGVKRKEFPPFGVLYLAASIEQERNWKVDIIAVDENTNGEELKWSEYDVIGFSIVSSYSYGILKRCYDASERRKDVVILAGGYQAEKFCNEVFRDFNADIIFKGEGEESIREFCRRFEDRNFGDIHGIIYRDNSNNIIPTEGRGIVDIDKIPEPARRLLDTNDIVMKNRLAGTEKKMVHMLFSRGCPYNCLYCAANQNEHNTTIRYRDKRKIVEELRNLVDTYDIEGFSIIDDCFLTEEDKAIEICDFIYKSKLNLVWSLAARVDHINDRVLRALKQAGCIEIKFGIETGSDELLKKMQKNIDVAIAEKAIRDTKKHDIGVKLFIITGLPGETDETHKATKQFLEKMSNENLVDRVSLLRYTPLAGSHIYDAPQRFGIDERALKIENFDKMSLYRKSHNWWSDKDRFAKCNNWYNDMQNFIDTRWKEE